ncbi:hypothetical protein BCPG3_105 [Bacillus phage BCPG3]|nr:hypothetical protein BCPG3_105 [Bacillus phage BCPG3]
MVNKENATIILNNFFMFPIMEETIHKTPTNPVTPRVHKVFKINKKPDRIVRLFKTTILRL